jgi:hypothetical protein
MYEVQAHSVLEIANIEEKQQHISAIYELSMRHKTHLSSAPVAGLLSPGAPEPGATEGCARGATETIGKPAPGSETSRFIVGPEHKRNLD